MLVRLTPRCFAELSGTSLRPKGVWPKHEGAYTFSIPGLAADRVDAGSVAPTISPATDFPAAATPFRTPIAWLRNPIVWATVESDIFPARIVSSIPSATRCNTLGGAGFCSAH